MGGMRVGRGKILRRGLGGVCTRPRTWWSGSAGARRHGYDVLSRVKWAEIDLSAALFHRGGKLGEPCLGK